MPTQKKNFGVKEITPIIKKASKRYNGHYVICFRSTCSHNRNDKDKEWTN